MNENIEVTVIYKVDLSSAITVSLLFYDYHDHKNLSN